MVKIYCRLGEYEKMMDASRKMLKYIKGKYQGDSVYRFLQSLHLDLNRLQKLYEITVEALEENKNQYMVWKLYFSYPFLKNVLTYICFFCRQCGSERA